MAYLPIEPHLIELVRRTDEAGFPLVIAGGLGIYLKRRHVAGERRRPTLIDRLPEARATADIDAFLRVEVFLRDKSEAVAALFAAPERPGCRTILAQTRRDSPVDPDLRRFTALLRELFDLSFTP